MYFDSVVHKELNPDIWLRCAVIIIKKIITYDQSFLSILKNKLKSKPSINSKKLCSINFEHILSEVYLILSHSNINFCIEFIQPWGLFSIAWNYNTWRNLQFFCDFQYAAFII